MVVCVTSLRCHTFCLTSPLTLYSHDSEEDVDSVLGTRTPQYDVIEDDGDDDLAEII